MTIAIQPVLLVDIDALAMLAREIWQHAYAKIITQSQIDYMLSQRYAPERLAAELGSPDIWWDQALAGDERVGFSSCLLTGVPGELKLDKLYVHPARQREGVGAALIERVLAHGRDHGCHTLVLAVNKQNSKAIAAYEKIGFSVREAVRVDIGGGFVMDDFIMTRSIPGAA